MSFWLLIPKKSKHLNINKIIDYYYINKKLYVKKMARKKRKGHCGVSKFRKKRKGTKCSGKTYSQCKQVKACSWKRK